MGSLGTFDSSLLSVKALISLESVYLDPPEDRERATVSALRGACTVLTVAAFEKFLRDLFEEELDRLRKAEIPSTSLPQKLYVEAAFASMELAIKGDHSNRGIEREVRLSNVLRAATLLSKDSFDPKALAATNSNPDSACVKRMFKAVGLSEIFKKASRDFTRLWGRQEVSGFEEQKLDGLMNSRHQVAHTAQALHISRPELTYNARFIEVLAKVLHDALSQYVTDIINAHRIANSAGGP
ncbi:HEPN domain-containing protein [Streptomyces sp. NPDC094473]|uniref:HEPN domain-containing protein n=1 Tax=Streptomyces sp. NPDC094473 TaxID=3366068 RepID=UPI00380E6130